MFGLQPFRTSEAVHCEVAASLLKMPWNAGVNGLYLVVCAWWLLRLRRIGGGGFGDLNRIDRHHGSFLLPATLQALGCDLVYHLAAVMQVPLELSWTHADPIN